MSHNSQLVCIVWFALMLGSCGASPGGEGAPCKDQGDCRTGLVCRNDICQKPDECIPACDPDAETCYAGTCYANDCPRRSCPGLGEVCANDTCQQTSCVNVKCPDGQRCAYGQCYPINCDVSLCPGYGEVCPDDATCDQGTCVDVQCPAGQRCAQGYCYPGDCASACQPNEVCYEDKCQDRLCVGVQCPAGQECQFGWCLDLPGCKNNQQDGDETDKDCGGSCPPCADGSHCLVPADCQSQNCQGGVCAAAPTCSDGQQNGDETDKDCGGSCPACADGSHCLVPADCQSQACQGGFCAAAPTCSDGQQNGNETDKDCGGSCPPCPQGKHCLANTDCATNDCRGGNCVVCGQVTAWKVPTVVTGYVGNNSRWYGYPSGNSDITTKVQADDSNYAIDDVSASSDSGELGAKGFGFAIPASAIVTGVHVHVLRATSGTVTNHDKVIQLLKGGSAVGANEANTGPVWPAYSSGFGWHEYGSSTDLWGTSFSPADINNSGFGFRLIAHNNYSGGVATAYVDVVGIRVFYCD